MLTVSNLILPYMLTVSNLILPYMLTVSNLILPYMLTVCSNISNSAHRNSPKLTQIICHRLAI